MLFFLSKIFWALMQPSNLLLLALVIAALTIRIRPTFARKLLRTAAVALFVVTFFPIGQWLTLPIEQRFPELVDLPERVDGIIVLGGAVDVGSSIGRAHVALNVGGDRLTVSADLARQRPAAKLIYSGIRGRLIDVNGENEDPGIARFYTRQGIEPARIVLEDKSRNTYENAVFSKELAQPEADDVWLLVTSAWHMPRAVGIFRNMGWPVVPVPVDFRMPRDPDLRSYLTLVAQPHVSDRLGELDHAVKIWAGLVAYRLMGRSTALLPGPEGQP